LQQRATLQSQLDRVGAGLVARLEQLQATENQLQRAFGRQPQLHAAVIDVGTQIEELEKKRVYLQRVQEKDRKGVILSNACKRSNVNMKGFWGKLDQNCKCCKILMLFARCANVL
jgi:exonuclease SbcC